MLSPREQGHSGIGLGWILAIALVGGILCFTALGYLLVWQIRKSGAPVTNRVYAADVAARPDGPSNSSTVLAKRRFLRTESELTLHANQDNMGEVAIPLQEGVRENGGRVVPWKPPVLPPLAKQGWMTTGDEEHGPKTSRRSWRDSWTNMMVLVGAKPTIPNVDSMNDLEVGAEQPVLDVPKTRSTPQAIPGSQTAPELGEEERGRPRTVSHYRGRAMGGPSVNDVDLKVILASTEQRLRGGSQSPVKTPKSSPGKNSTRTPRSGKSASTRGSPSKRSAIQQTPTKSRNPSISTVGSAANSLIRHAIEELEQPGGRISPSRARASEWEDQQKNTVAARPESPRKRSDSIESDISSALSTLYSVGEPEEEVTLPTPKKAVTPQEKQHDPFVHQSGPGVVSLRHGVAGPRRTRGTSGGGNDAASAIPAPLRTINANSKMAKRGSIKMQPHLVLSPPKARNPDIAAKIVTQRVPSENSIASESVYTDVTVADTSSEDEQTTPKAKQGHTRSKSSTSTVATPTRTMKSLDLSSSPLNEREVMSILYESARPRRGLPIPPTKIMLNDETIVPTPLSPRPKKRYAPSRRASIASVSSSNYDQNLDEENDQLTTIPGRRATMSGLGANLSVGSTISELRRMNSVVSSYSVASIASSCGGGIDRSPTITSLRGGGFSPDRPNTKNASDGRRNYLNMGGQTSPRRKNGSHRRGQSHSGIPIRADKIQVDMSAAEKENRGPTTTTTGPRVRFDLSASTNALRDGRDRRSGLAPPQLVASRVEAIAAEERRRANRGSADSLGLYDQDGFLKGSPDRDAGAKAGRWRM
ncbi:uncharacterized protein F5Z01DRAFT_239833 [Emericellopsis atlantica]|uniref:Uncharacterized protein n=1 Tax=Emericellopsis atlantica TaxID=2614577 RepID=A0A9P7ZI94_9HYPO|nr:uncharacterized protein F5Z01DRAFT_239833 [Emericellopsis atlantica]KAG9252277.1 hypothetical protein F5Z01DRAFT_239833 [Emericellopsis atlantica]